MGASNLTCCKPFSATTSSAATPSTQSQPTFWGSRRRMCTTPLSMTCRMGQRRRGAAWQSIASRCAWSHQCGLAACPCQSQPSQSPCARVMLWEEQQCQKKGQTAAARCGEHNAPVLSQVASVIHSGALYPAPDMCCGFEVQSGVCETPVRMDCCCTFSVYGEQPCACLWCCSGGLATAMACAPCVVYSAGGNIVCHALQNACLPQLLNCT